MATQQERHDALRNAIYTGNLESLQSLLATDDNPSEWLNEPIFHFDSTALIVASCSSHPVRREIVRTLLEHGADPNVRSRWWAGGFGVLDYANEDVHDLLLAHGTKWDACSAAAQGKLDVLREILDESPESVSAPGGDGMTPLHFAKSSEIIQLLLERGADVEARDRDHGGTAAQHQLLRKENLRLLLDHGAQADIYMAIVLDDVVLLNEILSKDPTAIDALPDRPPFIAPNSDGGHIYTYNVGSGMSPLLFAAARGASQCLAVLQAASPKTKQLLAAAWAQNEEMVEALLREDPLLGTKLSGEEAKVLPHAAVHGRIGTVRLLIKAGVDTTATGMDNGTALHIASWFGHADVVDILIPGANLESRDASHGSTVLGWACHGANVHAGRTGDHLRVVEALCRAGADVNAAANRDGTSMRDQCGKRDDVREILERYS